MMNSSKYKKRWFTFASLGLILVGAGLSMAIDAGFYRMNGATTINWVLYGTCSLIVFNAGLSFFGQAIIEKIKYDQQIIKSPE